MSHIVAIAGGSGGLGRAITEALKADDRYEPLILARKANPDLEKEIGVRFVAVDYSNVESLAGVLEENNVGTVITTMASNLDPSPFISLIQAAEKSKTTHRFIPNAWSGFVFGPEHTDFPLAATKIAQTQALQKTGLEWTAIYNGYFLDFFTPGLPTYVQSFPTVVDTANNAAGIPGSGDYPVNFTYTFDIAKYTVAALGLDKWEKEYFVVGDAISWNELVVLAEKAKGVKFDVAYDSAEKLEKGEVTELPGHKIAYESMGGEAVRPMFIGLLARMGLYFLKGMGEYGEGAYLNKMFPDIKPLKVDEAFAKAFQRK